MADTPATHSDPEVQRYIDELQNPGNEGLDISPYDLAAHICDTLVARGELRVDEIELAHHDYETRARRLLT
jgi:hypothetical protein